MSWWTRWMNDDETGNKRPIQPEGTEFADVWKFPEGDPADIPKVFDDGQG